jgi:hypothetical protein
VLSLAALGAGPICAPLIVAFHVAFPTGPAAVVPAVPVVPAEVGEEKRPDGLSKFG